MVYYVGVFVDVGACEIVSVLFISLLIECGILWAVVYVMCVIEYIIIYIYRWWVFFLLLFVSSEEEMNKVK